MTATKAPVSCNRKELCENFLFFELKTLISTYCKDMILNEDQGKSLISIMVQCNKVKLKKKEIQI